MAGRQWLTTTTTNITNEPWRLLDFWSIRSGDYCNCKARSDNSFSDYPLHSPFGCLANCKNWFYSFVYLFVIFQVRVIHTSINNIYIILYCYCVVLINFIVKIMWGWFGTQYFEFVSFFLTNDHVLLMHNSKIISTINMERDFSLYEGNRTT